MGQRWRLGVQLHCTNRTSRVGSTLLPGRQNITVDSRTVSRVAGLKGAENRVSKRRVSSRSSNAELGRKPRKSASCSQPNFVTGEPAEKTWLCNVWSSSRSETRSQKEQRGAQGAG